MQRPGMHMMGRDPPVYEPISCALMLYDFRLGRQFR
jgi:hypothetical protein